MRTEAEQKWAVIVEEAERSGLSSRAFARQHSLSKSSLARWQARLRPEPKTTFVEVACWEETPEPVVVEVGGASMLVTEHTDLELLRMVVDALC